MTAKARRMASEFQDHFREAMREAELESVKEEVANINRDLSAATSGMQGELNSIGSQMPTPPAQPLQLSGEATELDIPGLPPLEPKPAEAATSDEKPAEATGPETAKSRQAPDAPASIAPAIEPETPATERKAVDAPTEAPAEPKKPERKKRAAKPKAAVEAPAEGAAPAPANGSDHSVSDGQTSNEAAARPKPARKRAAKPLPSGDDRAA
jgi:hypothetical protein